MPEPPIDPARLERLAASYEDPRSEEWAIYADELQARGDPRGDLITIEQRMFERIGEPEYEELEAERAALLERHRERWLPPWFTETFENWGDGSRSMLSRFGYLSTIDANAGPENEDFAAWIMDALTCDAARFLEELNVGCAMSQLGSVVDAIARGSGWLRDIILWIGNEDVVATIPRARSEPMFRRLTHLRDLSLSGHRLFEELALEELEELRLWGFDAVVGWGETTALPGLRRLQLALFSSYRHDIVGPSQARLWSLFRPELLPALHRLDLSYNARGTRPFGRCCGGHMAGALFDAILDAPILDQLDELILPPPPTPSQFQAMLEAPRLRQVGRVQVPLSYFAYDPEQLERSPVRVEVGEVYPYRLVGQIDLDERVRVAVDDQPSFLVRPFWLANVIQPVYRRLSQRSQRVIGELLTGIDSLEPSAEEGRRPGLFARLLAGDADAAPVTTPTRLVLDHAELAEAMSECRTIERRAEVGLEELYAALERDRRSGARVVIEREPDRIFAGRP